MNSQVSHTTYRSLFKEYILSSEFIDFEMQFKAINNN
jgi:hypothetical protein